MRKFKTLDDFILSHTGNPTTDDLVKVNGDSTTGDGNDGTWQHNGVTGQTASQSPADLNNGLVNDADGNQWAIVINTVINVLWFGVTRDGVDSFAALTAVNTFWRLNPQTPGSALAKATERALYWPGGKYLASSDILFSTNDTGQVIYGDGPCSNLSNNIRIRSNAFKSVVRNLQISGTGVTGLELSDGNALNKRQDSVFEVLIRGRDTNLIIGEGAFGNLDNIIVESATVDNIVMREGQGYQISNVYSTSAAQDNWVVSQGGADSGEYKLTNCTGINAGRYNLRISGSTAFTAVEDYFVECTFTIAQRTRILVITSIVDIDGSNVKVTTSTSHLLFTGQDDVEINSTTSYNGNFTITVLSANEISVPVTYVGDEVLGNVALPNWDVFIDVADGGEPINRVNDMYFVAGNINYLYIRRGYNINFTGTRLKKQILMGEVNRVAINRSGRGRQPNTFEDVPVSGQPTGWTDTAYKDPSGSVTPGEGRMVISAPDKNAAVVGNIPALHELAVTEEGILATSLNSVSSDGVVADDTVFTTTPRFAAGIAFVSNGTGQNARGALVSYGSSGVFTYGHVGSLVDLDSIVLTGTTGTDGRMTISFNGTTFYIENRLASNQNFHVTFFR